MTAWIRRVAVTALSGLLAPSLLLVAGAADAATDDFYRYSGSVPLADIAPGTPLRTRTVPYHIQGLALPLQAVQILYRTRDQVGAPAVNATTVIRPVIPVSPSPRVLSYQSAYDSLNPADQPSTVIAGGTGLGGVAVNAETLIFAPALLAGYTINVPDTEGQRADFAAGPEYGYTTLDSLRAIARVRATGTGPRARIGLLGYSGGAIATEWAAELAAGYAPGVARRIVGSAFGGVLVDPVHNLEYVNGAPVWSGVIPMALIGIARSFHIDLQPYLSDYGKQVYADLEHASILDAVGHYPGLTWQQLAKPEYTDPAVIPVFVRTANQLIMGTGGTPTAPIFIGEGTGGEMEGTRASALYGSGDGVMLAGDVRTLARQYCAAGTTVLYREYPLSHGGTAVAWFPAAYRWLMARFGGIAAASNCGSIAPGNSLAPLPEPAG